MADARREMQSARDCIARAARTVHNGYWIKHDLGDAFTHGVMAWCLTHLRGKGTSSGDYHCAFQEKAPEPLKARAAKARVALHDLERGGIAPADAVEVVGAVVDTLLEAAAHPPRNRRRFPVRYRSDRPLRRPRVKAGGWIDTGRYRPAQLLDMMDDPPHIMTLSYGDEIDDDFRPHVVDWKTVRMRKAPPSLKDRFAPGDWIRHSRFGYGRLLAVRDSTMDAAFRHRQETLVPDAALRKIEKADGPEPEDARPLRERFPPGSWIEQDNIGPGVVVDGDDESLTVLQTVRLITIRARDQDPVVWKLDRPPLDLTLPRERRRIWCWRHRDEPRGRRPCPCCGYPNLGIADEFGLEPVQCILCGWADEWDGEEDADEVRLDPDPDDPLDGDRPNHGYSLTEARRNFEERGVMFRPDDPRAEPFARTAPLCRQLRQLLDETITGESTWREGEWAAIDRVSSAIIRAAPL